MNYPYELRRVPGTEALKELEERRAKGSGVALILGDEAAFEQVVEFMEDNGHATTAELLASAEAIDPIEWLEERRTGDPEYYEIQAGEWPEDKSPNHGLSAHLDVLTKEPLAEVVLTVLPASEAWMAPCYLRIGNWNDMPAADAHAALFKRWQVQYGAVVACLAFDVIELTVSNPPRTKQDALVLAQQQYIYCPDLVKQHLGSIEALAATLLNASVWYFWWD